MTQTQTHSSTRSSGVVSDPVAERTWKTWPDWVNLVLGAYLALAPIWTAGAPAGWFVTLGVLMVAVALWALGTTSSQGSEWTMIVLGAVTFLAPWIGGFAAAAAAAWTAWIIGVVAIVLAAVAMSQRTSLERRR